MSCECMKMKPVHALLPWTHMSLRLSRSSCGEYGAEQISLWSGSIGESSFYVFLCGYTFD